MTHRSRAGGPPKQAYSGKGRPKSGAATAGGAKGPKKLHHPPPTSAPAEPVAGPSRHPILDTPTDEAILSVIHSALSQTLDSEEFIPLVQKVKGLLYEKRWLDVFERPEEGWLEAYAGRWVPGRVLCFRDLLGGVPEIRELLLGGVRGENGAQDEVESDTDTASDSEEDDGVAGSARSSPSASPNESNWKPPVDRLAENIAAVDLDDNVNILSLGGGSGSEYLAIAALLAGAAEPSKPPSGKGKERAITWIGADLGAWDGVLHAFGGAARDKWGSPPQMEYIRTNLLTSTTDATPPSSPATSDPPSILQSHRPRLITLLYTLTELFTQSRPLTLSLLASLTSHSPPGTLLLVADSASDISEFSLGSAGRTWPVYMILDMVMLRPPPTGQAAWEVVEESDSRWYRLPPGVGATWRTKLENTRYWYRLYRRL